MKYNIYRKNGNTHRQGLSLDGFLMFCEKNDMKLFDVKQIEGTKDKSNIIKQTEEEFRKTLSPAQTNDVITGAKIIGKNNEGWYLKRVAETKEINISIKPEVRKISVSFKKGMKLNTILADLFKNGAAVRDFDLNAVVTLKTV